MAKDEEKKVTVTAPEPKPEEKDEKKEPFAVFPDSKSFEARVKREAKSSLAELVKEIGFDSADEMKNLVSEAQKIKEAQQTEKEKLEEKLAKSEKARLDAEYGAAEFKVRAIFGEVAAGKVQDIEAAYKLADFSSVKDNSDKEEIGSILAATLEKYPFLNKEEQKTSAGSSTSPGEQSGKELGLDEFKKLSREEQEKRAGEVKVTAPKYF